MAHGALRTSMWKGCKKNRSHNTACQVYFSCCYIGNVESTRKSWNAAERENQSGGGGGGSMWTRPDVLC